MNDIEQERERIRALIIKEAKIHEKAQLIDYYKFFYQSIFGANHIVSDKISVGLQIEKEIESPFMNSSDPIMDISLEKKIYRFPLYFIVDKKISISVIVDSFYNTILRSRRMKFFGWEKLWEKIKEEIHRLGISDNFDDKTTEEFNTGLKKGEEILHHSRIYHENYAPHYRIIDETGLENILLKNPDLKKYIV
jgi:hypothetical protein